MLSSLSSYKAACYQGRFKNPAYVNRQHVEGFYCPPEAPFPIPCPLGTYAPNPGVAFTNTCLACPSHHYCPRTALALPLLCGSTAQQPLSGQDTCVCPGEGQNFQASDAQCHCSLGYQPSNDKVCVLKLYNVCRNGKSRTQYGECLDRYQWSVHCKYQVCRSAEDFAGYDSELGLCLCKEPKERTSCGSLCRRQATDELKLHCPSNGELELVWRHENQVSSISGRVLQTLFLHWDPLETLRCSQQLNISRPVYIVQTTEEGFFGLLSGLPEELDHLFPITTQQETERFLEPEGLEEFWDYEHQIDLEAFSSTTFYSLLLKQNLSVTSRLGQLTTEVKELYKGVTLKLQLLQPCLISENRMSDSFEKIKREVEKEIVRRKAIGSQLRTLLDKQLKVYNNLTIL
ncbi:hypothetical protein WMY93_028734 [Mugilogobius chulae]|uniref:Uncharacterized protein n=1 Tax=Mugilogobius chulae TaxID=88201 RepID=A0AAW0MQ73_9GOBI